MTHSDPAYRIQERLLREARGELIEAREALQIERDRRIEKEIELLEREARVSTVHDEIVKRDETIAMLQSRLENLNAEYHNKVFGDKSECYGYPSSYGKTYPDSKIYPDDYSK